MKVAALCLVFAAAEKCPPVADNCGDTVVSGDPNPTVHFHTAPNFQGEAAAATVTGIFGCSNQVPGFEIKSMKSSFSAMMVLHAGPDCTGNVLAETGTDFFDMPPLGAKPRSVFIKHHRIGSC